MDFNPIFQGPQYLSSLSLGSPYFKRQTQTMFPSQSSILVPPSPPPIMFDPNNSFHHFQNCIMDVPTYNPPFAMEVPSKPITTPIYGIPTPSLGDGSSLGGFVDNHHNLMMLTPINNKVEALNGHQKGKVIWDFSQKTMIYPSKASSSKSPPLFSLFDKYGLGMTEYHRDTDQKVKAKKNTNIGNDGIIKGQWTIEEDSALVELVNQFGVKKWSQIAKLLHNRIGKQCRERWYNHLQPNIKKDSWTLEEDMILIKAHKEVGNKWSKIAKKLTGRAENTIKNHWNGSKRCQNCKRHNKNKHNPYEGSILHAYVRRVIAIEEATKGLKKSINKKKNKVLKCKCDELTLLSID